MEILKYICAHQRGDDSFNGRLQAKYHAFLSVF